MLKKYHISSLGEMTEGGEQASLNSVATTQVYLTKNHAARDCLNASDDTMLIEPDANKPPNEAGHPKTLLKSTSLPTLSPSIRPLTKLGSSEAEADTETHRAAGAGAAAQVHH